MKDVNHMKKLDKLFKKSRRLKIDDKSKIVIMSDCHRGAGNNDDNFIKNQNIYDAALNHYFDRGFTYIELGDGDEMWEVANYEDIIAEHIETFKELKKFHDHDRLIMMYGNHDIIKKNPAILKKYFYYYEDKKNKETKDLLADLNVYESLVLEHPAGDIFLLHGHQADFLNSTLWPVARFLVRHLWSNLERLGIADPTSAAKNYRIKSKVEKKLQEWSDANNKMLIAGHTHRPVLPISNHGLYFNDGSCIHPNGITCIEIENDKISLVKWILDVNASEQIVVRRFVLEGNVGIRDYFKKNFPDE